MSSRLKRAVFLTLTVVLLLAAGLAVAPLQGMRLRYDLSNQPVKGLSPQLALATQVLAWGRGLIIDVIWIRMEKLKREERFFELVQLADWACKLAPRFPEVWDIQAWNLAYNVSCRVPYLPDRYRWIEAAIKLLRDEGIPQNPYSAMLYDRLAWIFFHKIGEQMDNAHMFYKEQFGLSMHEVLGGEGGEKTLKALIGAPQTLEELLQDPDTKRLCDECATYDQFDLVEGFFDVYRRTPSVPPAVMEIVGRPENVPPMMRIAAFARARRLREELKMDPALMLALRDKYGPFDWRSPYPHAIYWATRGMTKLDELELRTIAKFREFGKAVPNPYEDKEAYYREGERLYEFRRVTLRRIIYASMQSLVRHGRLLFDSKGRLLLEAGSDYRFADATLPLFEEIINGNSKRFAAGARIGLLNFLSRGLIEFYFIGDVKKSMEYFRRLKTKYPDEVKGLTFDEYRRKQTQYAVSDMTTAEGKQLAASLLRRAFYALGCNAEDKAAAYQRRAEVFVKQWNKIENLQNNLRDEIRLDRLKEAIIVDIVTGAARFPPDVRSHLLAELRKKKDDVVRKILANLEASKVYRPEVEKVEEDFEWAHF